MNSSQALAIDVFGYLAAVSQDSRDQIIAKIARQMSLPESGPWKVTLEWIDPKNRLNENPRGRTQVDAVLESPQVIICCECKFTESDGGACSQPTKHRSGMIQCNGNYTAQTNPINSVDARCALTGKGIRYWDFIPTIFQVDADADHSPCPYAGPWFQWMRNLTVAYAAGESEKRTPGFLLIYADHPTLPVAQLVKSERWSQFLATLRDGRIKIGTLSYQQLIKQAQTEVSDAAVARQLSDLADWVHSKVQRVCDSRL